MKFKNKPKVLKKRCNLCGKYKARGYFNKDHHNPDGLCYKCKTCAVDRARQLQAKEAARCGRVLEKYRERLAPLQKQERELNNTVAKMQKTRQVEAVFRLKEQYKQVVGKIQAIFQEAERLGV